MKKIYCFTILLFVLISTIACGETKVSTTIELTNTTATQISSTSVTTTTTISTLPTTVLQTINFKFDDYEGSGSLIDPYQISITEKETFSKVINFFVLPNHLIYEKGSIEQGEFITSLENEGINIEDSNDFSLVIESITLGEYYIRISSVNALPTYVKVTVEEYILDFTKNLKVLAIGNSFSVDAMEYLYKIADSYGIPNITLGNLYIPGASLATHYNSISNNLSDYVYYKNTNDSWQYHNSNATLFDGLVDEDWDIITIQQVSSYSGLSSTYNSDIDSLIAYVNEYKTNDDAQIVWHMTWAYQSDSTHPNFPTYSSNQLTMYNAIIDAVQEKIDMREDIAYVIPSGTAIQNLRTSYLGDTLTRDGYHLSLDKGRYTAALTWFLKITGLSIDDITYKPIGVSEQEAIAIKDAVKKAIDNPYVITDSAYPDL